MTQTSKATGEKCAQCGRNILTADPTYSFRNGVYHSWCKDLLQLVTTEVTLELRRQHVAEHWETGGKNS